MENITKPSKSYLQFGLFYGLIMILTFVLMFTLGINPIESKTLGLSQSLLNNLILPLLFIYLACQNFKKNNNGFASFVECLKVGVSIGFIAGLTFAGFNLIFNFLFPEYAIEMMKAQRELMITQNPEMTSEQIEMGISVAKKIMNPIILFPVTLIMFSFFGLIYSLIIGMIVKNDNPQGL